MANIHFDFGGQTVLVTGASRGIGFGIAEAFATSGASVFLLAESDDVYGAAHRLQESAGVQVRAIKCDISDRAGVDSAIEEVGRIDILVNNAGLELITPLLDRSRETEAAFRRITDINTLGTYYVTRAAAATMATGSRIIFTASIWSRISVAEFSAYCASKHAVLGFMRSTAVELAPRGIRVNAVCPGWVRTEASLRSLRDMSRRCGRSEDDLLDEIVGNQTFGGLMEPADVAPVYLFLASDAAANMTGQAIMADRGEVMA